MKITIIGAGHMGGTAARSFAASPLFTPDDITVTARSRKTLDGFEGTGIRTMQDNKEAVKGADVIVISVRPGTAMEVCQEIAPVIDFQNQIIISFVAGIPSSEYLEWFGKKDPSFFLVMPNIAMEVNEGLTLIAPIVASPIQTSLIKAIFDCVGKSLIIKEEAMGSGMSLASCGVAFAMEYILSSAEGGVSLGFSKEEAIKIVLQTVKGAAMVLEAHGSAPEYEISKIATPGGYTRKGITVMEESDFSEVVLNALKASTK